MINPILDWKEDESGTRYDYSIMFLSQASIKNIIGSLDKQYNSLVEILSDDTEDLHLNFKSYNAQLKDVIDLINILSDYDKT